MSKWVSVKEGERAKNRERRGKREEEKWKIVYRKLTIKLVR